MDDRYSCSRGAICDDDTGRQMPSKRPDDTAAEPCSGIAALSHSEAVIDDGQRSCTVLGDIADGDAAGAVNGEGVFARHAPFSCAQAIDRFAHKFAGLQRAGRCEGFAASDHGAGEEQQRRG